ncbi:uncharacterized protein [Montipora foliosa]|uniref:uncharacterized protein isoform X2 n=1 Tax=Montipora foliosa TaxID=591990 RepID=UPI0035F1E7F7
MQIFTIAALGIGLVYLVSLARGKVEQYKMNIKEKGTRYQEEIDVDEDEDVEVFRVPKRNGVEAADFYHDFKMGVTVTRLLSRKACHISKLDPSMSSPKKMKADLDLVASRGEDIPTVTDSSLEMIIGPANRLLLTKEILDFCGALPIYNTEHTKVDLSYGNGTAVIRNRRQKRATVTIQINSCLAHAGRDPLEFVKRDRCDTDRNVLFDLSCKLVSYRTCFYYVTCKRFRSVQWICHHVHRISNSPICCDFVCPCT